MRFLTLVTLVKTYLLYEPNIWFSSAGGRGDFSLGGTICLILHKGNIVLNAASSATNLRFQERGLIGSFALYKGFLGHFVGRAFLVDLVGSGLVVVMMMRYSRIVV